VNSGRAAYRLGHILHYVKASGQGRMGAAGGVLGGVVVKTNINTEEQC